jgi:hypothetical protein
MGDVCRADFVGLMTCQRNRGGFDGGIFNFDGGFNFDAGGFNFDGGRRRRDGGGGGGADAAGD